MEFLAGTDPMSADSALAIIDLSRTSNGQVSLAWSTVVNRTYRVQYCDDLSGATRN